MPQKTREEILEEVTSDHLPQMFEIELSSNSKSGESSSSTKKTKVNIVTWNILNQCKSPDSSSAFSFGNNPWNYEESKEDFGERLDIQANQLCRYMGEGFDIFCLQECSNEAAEKIKNELGDNFDFKTFESESLSKNKKGKESYTFYDKTKFNFIKSNNTFFSKNQKNPNKGVFLGLAITFQSIASEQNFVVENVHGPFNQAKLVIDNLIELKKIIQTSR